MTPKDLEQIDRLLIELENRLDKRLGGKLDLKFEENNKKLLKQIQLMIDDSEANIISSVDKVKADKSQVEELERKLKN